MATSTLNPCIYRGMAAETDRLLRQTASCEEHGHSSSKIWLVVLLTVLMNSCDWFWTEPTGGPLGNQPNTGPGVAQSELRQSLFQMQRRLFLMSFL